MKILLMGSGSYKSSLSAFRLVGLAQHLLRDDWQISLMLPAADKYNHYKADYRAQIPRLNLIQPRHLAYRHLGLNLISYLPSSILAVFKLRPDIILISKPTPITVGGLIAKIVLHRPLILDLDDLGSEVMRQEGRNFLEVTLVNISERLTMRLADAVIVASSYLEQAIKQKYPNKPLLLLSNGVNPNEFKLPTIKQPRSAIYYFGSLNRLSLIEDFIKALPAVLKNKPETKITIIGDGQALPEVKKLVKTLGLKDRVLFAGWVKPSAINQFIEYGDIAVCTQPDIPTVRAASNLKVFQYMALGSVPIVSSVGDLPSYIGFNTRHPAGVVVNSGQITDISKRLIWLLNHPNSRLEFAEQGRYFAVSKFSWATLADKLANFITEQLQLSGSTYLEGATNE